MDKPPPQFRRLSSWPLIFLAVAGLLLAAGGLAIWRHSPPLTLEALTTAAALFIALALLARARRRR